MAESISPPEIAPKWARVSSSALAGWNVFLFSAVLIVIEISIVLSKLGIGATWRSGWFIAGLLVSGAATGFAGIYVGKKTYEWFSKKSPVIVYTSLGVLVLFSILSFPRTFGFVV